MTDPMTAQNVNLSSWDTLYRTNLCEKTFYAGVKQVTLQFFAFHTLFFRWIKERTSQRVY